MLLRDWLLELRPPNLEWHNEREAAADVAMLEKKKKEAEARYHDYAHLLVGGGYEHPDPHRELVSHLLGFHGREAKPQWWVMFDRQDREEGELIDEADCLGGLRLDPETPPESEDRSNVFTYRFAPEEYKLREGSNCLVA